MTAIEGLPALVVQVGDSRPRRRQWLDGYVNQYLPPSYSTVINLVGFEAIDTCIYQQFVFASAIVGCAPQTSVRCCWYDLVLELDARGCIHLDHFSPLNIWGKIVRESGPKKIKKTARGIK